MLPCSPLFDRRQAPAWTAASGGVPSTVDSELDSARTSKSKGLYEQIFRRGFTPRRLNNTRNLSVLQRGGSHWSRHVLEHTRVLSRRLTVLLATGRRFGRVLK